jgi:hypothetical protein
MELTNQQTLYKIIIGLLALEITLHIIEVCIDVWQIY